MNNFQNDGFRDGGRRGERGNRDGFQPHNSYSHQNDGATPRGKRPRFTTNSSSDAQRPRFSRVTPAGEQRPRFAQDAAQERRPRFNAEGYNDRRPRFNETAGQERRQRFGQQDGEKQFRPKRQNNPGLYSQKKRIAYEEKYEDPTKPIRLNKYLANAGICSRREADDFILAGVISVNGVVVSELGAKVLPTDKVMFHEQPVRREKKVYILTF